MGIRDKRFFRAVNRIIREELQKGNLPSSKEFSYRLNQYLAEHDLSRPEYNFKPVREGSTARSYDYNKSMNDVYSDLGILYENTIDLHNYLTKNFSKFEVDKSKLEYEVNVLENQLKEDILLYNNNGYLNSVYDVFDDMSKVDATKTDAHVDVKKHEITIPELKNTSRKIAPPITRCTFNVLPELKNSVKVMGINGEPQNALSDSINSTWQELIVTDIKQNVAGYYFLEFDEKQTINRIEVSVHGMKPTMVRIEFSPDSGLNWFTLPYYEEGKLVADSYLFDFPSLDATNVRILLQRSEPDDASDTNNFALDVPANTFQYTMGLKHLGFYQMAYPPLATFVSTPLKVDVPAGTNFSISKVSLNVDESIVPATDIKYWIATPPASGDPEWKPISPVNRENPAYDQIIDFRNITNAPANKMSIDPNLSLAEFTREDLKANGISFYQIGSVENKSIVNSTERLYAGANSWGIKKFAYQQADHDTHVPTMLDWAKPQDYEFDFVEIEDGKPGLLMDGVTHTAAYNYMFTAGVLSSKYQNTESCIPASTEPITVYVNGQIVFSGIPDKSSKVPFTFNYGWNEVVVLLYTRNVDAANGVTLDMNIDMRDLGTNVYSQASPMSLVSLHDLRYNVKSNDRNSYAIEVVNDKANIILNHADPGLQYDFYFNYIQGDAQDTILFKAELSKNDTGSSISPKLSSYRLRFS
jgi:hypothetical protein